MQLHELVDIKALCLIMRPQKPVTYTHYWVQTDGPYDDLKSNTRFFIMNGFAYFSISRLWIDSGDHSRLDPWMRRPWETYPDLPPKPEKK
jgi:hypothetical protein